MGLQERSPIAVLISDVHYRVDTLDLADNAMRQSIDKADYFGVPLVVMGDLNDTKAIIRGEVANALIKTMSYAAHCGVEVFILIGNHDLLNEKGVAHSLEFLKPYAKVIESPEIINLQGRRVLVIPYQSTREAFKTAILMDIRLGCPTALTLCHQGIIGAEMGGYMQDHSAITTDDIEHVRVISGHYHKHHTVGTLTYVGNPYSLTFGEAKDGPKGFCVLYNDGSLEQIPTNLRKHVIIEIDAQDLGEMPKPPLFGVSPEDLVWFKLSGTSGQLEPLTKEKVGKEYLGRSNFKFDKIVTDSPNLVSEKLGRKSDSQILDFLIDSSGESEIFRVDIKKLYREVMS